LINPDIKGPGRLFGQYTCVILRFCNLLPFIKQLFAVSFLNAIKDDSFKLFLKN